MRSPDRLVWPPVDIATVGAAHNFAQITACAGSARPVEERFSFAKSAPASDAFGAAQLGHGEDEKASPLLAVAAFERREQSAFNLEAQAVKISADSLRTSARKHSLDVLDERPPGAALDDDPAGWSPRITLVEFSETLPCLAMRLTGDAAKDAVHSSTKLAAWEGAQIRPDRRLNQETFGHRFAQSVASKGFPLHHADCSSVGNSQFDGEVESATSCAKADVLERGIYIHVTTAPSR